MSAEAFKVSAIEFCQWVEIPVQGSGNDELLRLRLLLANLLNLAPTLDAAKKNFEAEEPDVPDDRWEWVKAKIKVLPLRYYQMMFDPCDFEVKEPCTGDLADDIADIYRDLKAGLMMAESDGLEASTSHWWTLQSHWLAHAIWAFAAVEQYRIANCIYFEQTDLNSRTLTQS